MAPSFANSGWVRASVPGRGCRPGMHQWCRRLLWCAGCRYVEN